MNTENRTQAMDADTKGLIESLQKRLDDAEARIASLEQQAASGTFVKYEDVIGLRNTHAVGTAAPIEGGAWVRHYDRILKIDAVGAAEQKYYETDKQFKIKKL